MTEHVALSHVEHSTSVELMVESAFLSEILQEMWFARRQIVDVLHSTVDAFGYDVVLQCGDVMRHVQLKARKKGGATSHYAISTLLRDRPAGCVVHIEWDHDEPTNRMEFSYRWFGGDTYEPLPDIGLKVSRHARANAQGVKAERPGMRDVKLTAFEKLDGVSELADRLFGPPSHTYEAVDSQGSSL